MTLTFDELVAPVTDLGSDFDEAIYSWRWLIAKPCRPLLISALGDVFIEIDGGVHLLNTFLGSLDEAARSIEAWKREMQKPERVGKWFLPRFVDVLREAGLRLESGEVFSPTIPPVLGGAMSAENFSPSQWRMHLHVLGQIHEQIRDLPPGTRIDKIWTKTN